MPRQGELDFTVHAKVCVVDDHFARVGSLILLRVRPYREEQWRLEDSWYSIHFFELIGDTMWGATAVMVRCLLEVITGPETAPTD